VCGIDELSSIAKGISKVFGIGGDGRASESDALVRIGQVFGGSY
jgi:hypothetical protein